MNLRKLLLFALLLGFIGAGCATTSEPEEEKVSTIPWNKPQKWEKKGPVGGGVGY